jgi:polyribonucleotide nucleotidyltransferase
MINNEIKSVMLPLPDGRIITLESGLVAKQAAGAVVVKMGNAVLLATVTTRKEENPPSFLPLSVDYQERFAGSGRIPGGFLRREGRSNDHEVLICRLVDRALRPCFPAAYRDAVQVNIILLSADEEVAADSLAALAASTALTLSPLPFYDPISEVRVARVDGAWVVNPTPAQQAKATIDLIVAASRESILMVEGEMQEASEAEVIEALKIAHEAIKIQCAAQAALAAQIGTAKPAMEPETSNPIEDWLLDYFQPIAHKVISQTIPDNIARKAAFDEMLEAAKVELKQREDLPATWEEIEPVLSSAFSEAKKVAHRAFVLQAGKRIDGRKFDQVRHIETKVGYLPTPHGSALFTRGETQVITSVTLGSKSDEKKIDRASYNGASAFMLDYNFPSFSTGEVKPNRGLSRREIGHGNLAERALRAILPSGEQNPYTIRTDTITLSSNGSSSMATVCANTLALYDAGIKLKKPVAGIAMGLISDDPQGQAIILSDIAAEEDQIGDMDFKVTRTTDGITACQMDIKMKGIDYDTLAKALEQASAGCKHILGVMAEELPAPRENYKAQVPRIHALKVAAKMVGALIGPGGKVIQEVERETGASISIDTEDKFKKMVDVQIFASNQTVLDDALARINSIVCLPEVGTIYVGRVKSLKPYGAFVEFMPGKDGLLHVSQISEERVEDVENVLAIGEEVKIKLIAIDEATGRFSLSKKAVD